MRPSRRHTNLRPPGSAWPTRQSIRTICAKCCRPRYPPPNRRQKRSWMMSAAGATDAAFMDRLTAIAALLKQTGCGGHSLRWLPVPEVQSELGVGSTFETKAVADAIRHEI